MAYSQYLKIKITSHEYSILPNYLSGMEKKLKPSQICRNSRNPPPPILTCKNYRKEFHMKRRKQTPSGIKELEMQTKATKAKTSEK